MSAVPPTPDPLVPTPSSGAESAHDRRKYRPPIGIPIARQRTLGGAIVSIGLHLLVVFLLIFPFLAPDVVAEMLGAGGPGPAGGGGGGTGGTGGGRVVSERVQYVVPMPPPPTQAPDPERFQIPIEKPPEIKPPELTPPEVKPLEPTPVAQPTSAASDVNLAVSDAASKVAGSGGGSGNDGSGGSGSGSGGGVGSGIGTGRGSGVGAGTGGGSGLIYPPTPAELFIPPIPVPNAVKGRTITIVFDVDSTGKVIDFELTPTRDAGYNRKLREILGATRFRPATDGTGRAVRAKYNLDYTF